MSYVALYRKFRPQTFEEVRGQDPIVATLKNQIKADRIGHAYLFCGTRGTGKTSIAKIFAKAVNCEHPVDGSPCGECASCRAIADGSSMNVVEMDAASNNGVDDVRSLKEQVSYPPTEGRYRVFIIDEAHMLSINAFNALLKTIEEPPSYVIFILATTEVNKIPITILSRCQRYDFRRISTPVITQQLKDLTEAEKVEAEPKALSYIAKKADGSMRDALSLLDQCIAFYLGQPLTYEHVLDVLGAMETETFHTLFGYIRDGDVSGALDIVNEVVLQGKDLDQFVTELLDYLRSLLLVKSGADVEELLQTSDEGMAQLREDAEGVEEEELLRWIRIFSDLANRIRYSSTKRVLVEVALIKLCKPQMERSYDSLLERMDRMEERLDKIEKEGASLDAEQMTALRQAAQAVANGAAAAQGADAAQKAPMAKPHLPEAVPEDVKQVVSNWRQIIRNLSEPSRSYLSGAKLSLCGDNRLQIVCEDSMAYGYMHSGTEHIERLEEEIEKTIGKHVEIQIDELPEGQNFEDHYINLEDIIHTNIEVED